jgi:hypothetical protein
MTWYLVFSLFQAPMGAIGDPCIQQGVCSYVEHRIVMPSLEVCKAVKDVNPNSKCLGEQVEK